MASIAVNSSAAIPVQGGEVFTVTAQHGTIWRATFVPLATPQQASGTGRSYGPLAMAQTFGPFNTPGTLTIENQASTIGAALTYSQTGGVSASQILAQSGVPRILLPTGSSNATGQITLGTALAYTPVGVVFGYLPAGVVTSGVQTGAGMYPMTFSSTTVAQLTDTTAVTANAAYTQTTGSALVLASANMAGGAMGANGSVRVRALFTNNNSAGTKQFICQFGGASLVTNTNTTSITAGFEHVTSNRGAQNAQVTQFNDAYAASAVATTYQTVDTSQAVTFGFASNQNTATDYSILESYTIEVLPLQ